MDVYSVWTIAAGVAAIILTAAAHSLYGAVKRQICRFIRERDAT